MEAIKISELETSNISAAKNWKDHGTCLLYENISKVHFNEVTEHKQHVTTRLSQHFLEKSASSELNLTLNELREI